MITAIVAIFGRRGGVSLLQWLLLLLLISVRICASIAELLVDECDIVHDGDPVGPLVLEQIADVECLRNADALRGLKGHAKVVLLSFVLYT